MLNRTPLEPIEKLRNTIDLIVVTAIRKREQFVQKISEPGGILGQVNMAGLNLCRLRDDPVRLTAFRLDSDGRVIQGGMSDHRS